MFQPNPILIREGYQPAKAVADLIGKAHSTIHRMVHSGRLQGVRDGRCLYVNVESLVQYYERLGNKTMARAIRRKFEKCGSK